MSKTITIQTGLWSLPSVEIDVDKFAEHVAKGVSVKGYAVTRYLAAGLLTHTDDGGVDLTPRGHDLLASRDSIPEDPPLEPESAGEPCKACNGTGKQQLLISEHTCDVCLGHKVVGPSVKHTLGDKVSADT